MKYFLGIDFGGGASKATLLSQKGEIVATAKYEYPTLYPKSGWTEQNPDDWYLATKENIKSVVEKSGIDTNDICTVSLDAATHTAVVMDEDFNVLRPSIYWTDTRSVNEVNYLKENYSEIIDKQVFHKPDTIWTLPQLMWIKNNEPENFSKIKKIFFAKDYVRHQLTGDYVTDYIEAEGSMFFDGNNMCWSKELCGILGIDIEMLPKIVSPFDVVGKVTKKAAEDTGLAEGTDVICGTTDTVMEVFAAGGVTKGKMTVKLATAGRICVVTDKAYPNQHLINYSHIVDGLWYPGTATKSCASSYRWFRDSFGENYEELDKGATKVGLGADGLIFHPYLNGELTPYADPKLCGSFVGIRSGHTKAHFARAVLEGVCMSLLDCKKALDSIGIEYENEATVIGGGSHSSLWRQITADVLNTKLIVRKYSDSSFGSSMLAGIASGAFKDCQEALEICNEKVSETLPNVENNKKYLKIFDKYKKIHDALVDIYHE